MKASCLSQKRRIRGKIRPTANGWSPSTTVLAGRYGRTATTPLLWIDTANDSYFAPPITQAPDTHVVKSDAEKNSIAMKATAAAGSGKVVNDLKVAPNQ